jgi:glycosyltransferase involved in cell wall biosynthesis
VVALGCGGALETVIDGETGFFAAEATAECFADGVARALNHTFDAGAIRRHAEGFSRQRFADQIAAQIAEPGAW